jgi:hypothetical protein
MNNFSTTDKLFIQQDFWISGDKQMSIKLNVHGEIMPRSEDMTHFRIICYEQYRNIQSYLIIFTSPVFILGFEKQGGDFYRKVRIYYICWSFPFFVYLKFSPFLSKNRGEFSKIGVNPPIAPPRIDTSSHLPTFYILHQFMSKWKICNLYIIDWNKLITYMELIIETWKFLHIPTCNPVKTENIYNKL